MGETEEECFQWREKDETSLGRTGGFARAKQAIKGDVGYHEASTLWNGFMNDVAALIKDQAGQIVNFSDEQETYSAEYQVIAGGKAIYLNVIPTTVPSDVPAGEKAIRTVTVKVLGLGNGKAVIESEVDDDSTPWEVGRKASGEAA